MPLNIAKNMLLPALDPARNAVVKADEYLHHMGFRFVVGNYNAPCPGSETIDLHERIADLRPATLCPCCISSEYNNSAPDNSALARMWLSQIAVAC